ncbi:MAG: hypothetical protein ACRDYA_09000 [Egibacteraceae bacterium]
MGEHRDVGVDAELFMRVSGGLKEALAALGTAAHLPQDQRGWWQRRLVAITNTAKRDLGRAEVEIQRFHADWTREVGTS